MNHLNYIITHKLIYIPFALIERSLEGSRLSLKEQDEFNTHHHSHDEISAVLPHVCHYPREGQPWILLEPFLPIITASQGYHENRVHRVLLPRPLIAQLPRVSQSCLILGHISESDKEDLNTLFPHDTTRGLEIDSLVRQKKFLIRLDDCSLKDAQQGSGPVKSIVDLWVRLATSARGMRGAIDLQAAYPDMLVNMWLLPWQDETEPSLEYRVFCPPPRIGQTPIRIAAISQYRWHEEWRNAWQRERAGAIIQKLAQECDELLKQILQCEGMTENIRQHGFVFNVAVDPKGGPVQLIELNDFGAMTGCGSCLFHWIRDAKVLYGLQNELEVRVTLR